MTEAAAAVWFLGCWWVYLRTWRRTHVARYETEAGELPYLRVLRQLPSAEREMIVQKLHERGDLERGQRRLLDLLESIRIEKSRLNRAQCAIVGMLREGMSVQEIAVEFGVSRYTMRDKVRQIADVLTGDPRGARSIDLPALAEQQEACP